MIAVYCHANIGCFSMKRTTKPRNKQSEKNVEEQFHLMSDAAPNGMMMVDQEENIVLINPQIEKIFGYTQEELIGQTLEILVPDRFKAEHPVHVKHFFAHPSARQLGAGRDLFGRHKNGAEIPVEIGLNPIETDEGAFVIAFVINITERKKLESIKDDFIGMVSHELRTPLTVIGLGIENLQAGLAGPVSQKQKEILERNDRNVRRLARLIDNLLDLSRMQSGRSKIRREALNLNALIEDVLQSFRAEENGKEQAIEKEFMPNLPEVEADPDMISQVVTNLLSNAVRYARKKIVITTKTVNGTGGIPEFAETRIANDGPGISREDQDRLFKKFVQLDREKRIGAYKGTGLGLALCKEIIERHKGKIWVESPAEQGITFCFTLPIRGGNE